VTFVVDSSVSLSWCFEDERTPATAALLDRVAETAATPSNEERLSCPEAVIGRRVGPIFWSLRACDALEIVLKREPQLPR